jgi:hypothetical protein
MLQNNIILDNVVLDNIYDNSFKLIEELINNNNNNNRNLNPFIELFNKKSNRYCYFPSYFLKSNLRSYSDDFNLLDYILYQQYHVLNVHSTLSYEYLEDISNLIHLYIVLNNRL